MIIFPTQIIQGSVEHVFHKKNLHGKVAYIIFCAAEAKHEPEEQNWSYKHQEFNVEIHSAVS